jgi:dihydropteroate synthase
VDPGIGFGKTLEHNLDILAHLDAFARLGRPVIVGVSRKSFIGRLSRDEAPKQRVAGSLAAGLFAVLRGAHILRVHDVAETRQALAVWQAIAHKGALASS